MHYTYQAITDDEIEADFFYDDSVVYLVWSDGDQAAGEKAYYAMFKCPCGCGEDIYLNLIPDTRPCWLYNLHDDQSVSLQPSINRQVGCKSHFWMRAGNVEMV